MAEKKEPSTPYILLCFALWYAINIVYNYTNKKVLKVFPFPLTCAAAQLACGLLYFMPLWLLGLRAVPKPNINAVAPIGVIHGLGNVVTVASLGAGSLSFVNVVKALEPFFNVVFGVVFLNDKIPLPVLLTLVPVVVGVAVASASELDFTWLCFTYAMGSNLMFSLRGVLSKKLSKKAASYRGEDMFATNQFAIVTIIAFVFVLPLALVQEGAGLVQGWQAAAAKGSTDVFGIQMNFLGLFLTSGISFYMYNEVSMVALDAVHPVTHAVGNTIKRVILILLSVLAFGTKLTTNGIIGSSVAIMGVLLYSLAKAKFTPPAKKADPNAQLQAETNLAKQKIG